ncbi:MAG: PfkB family carbohydrate kinase [Pseudomonadota bacterium]
MKVLLAGVAVLDFVFRMEAFPRTAEKYRADGADIVGGGNAANAAVAVARLGGHAQLISRLGDDTVATLIQDGLVADGVDTSLMRRFTGRRSSFSSIYIDATGERQIMNYRDNALTMDADWLADILPDDCGAVLADTRWPQGAKAVMDHAKRLGVPGIMDAEAPVREAEEAIHAASHVAFSAQGVREFTGLENVEEAALKAATMLPGQVLVTDGEHGTVSVHHGKIIHTPARKITVVDSLGAGDVWHGAFALALAKGWAEERAVPYANAAASLKCTRPGGRNGAPTADELAAFLEEETP